MSGKPKTKKKIIPQMFDVRPVDDAGDLDLELIGKIKPIIELARKERGGNDRFLSEIRELPPIKDISLPEFDPHEAEAKRFRAMIAEERNARTRMSAGSEDYFDGKSGSVNGGLGPRPRHRQPELYLKNEDAYSMPDSAVPEIEKDPVAFSVASLPNGAERRPAKSRRKQKSNRRIFRKLAGVLANAAASLLSALFLPFRLAAKAIEAVIGSAVNVGRSMGTAARIGGKNVSGWGKSAVSSGGRSIAAMGSFADGFLDFFSSIFPGSGSRRSSRRRSYSKRRIVAFVMASAFVMVAVLVADIFSKGMRLKKTAALDGSLAYANLIEAKDGIKGRDFDSAAMKFDEAYGKFSEISNDVDGLGKILVESSRFVPFLSKLSTGSHLAEAGKDISRIGSLSSDLIKTLDQVKNPLGSGESVSYLDLFNGSNQKVGEISALMLDLEENLDKVNVDDLPEEQRGKFSDLKRKLPSINAFLGSYLKESQIFVDVLGGNGPRKYLFLFQNNQEMRPTGGFIGTYAALDIFDGRIKRFVVDGIFNPDGQLREKVVPPAPIQKISANWSLHDSNWFPDFPTSAEKAMWFYEKTGGPTVDGVITMTPTVMQKLLEVTGPIEMEDYGVTVDKDNFLQTVQQEVEVDYDKDLNQPKKILADLAPKILDRIFNMKSMPELARATDVLMESLNEKHILIYSRNPDLERIISDNGWSGEMLETGKDYLSVVNSNINGYKTDGVIDQRIEHEAEIQQDGSIMDKVTITRHHNGGDTGFEWWNKVNADYMRLYVPKGSKLLSVSGQTRETDQSPVDYETLGFKKDPQLSAEDQTATIDEESGTRISEESGKTVFANWVYVSPKETAQITYSYLLPFKIEAGSSGKPADTYSLLVQKQSGSVSSDFSSEVTYPDRYDRIWEYPENGMKDAEGLDDGRVGIRLSSDLQTDYFMGLAFKDKSDELAKGLPGIGNLLSR